MQAASSGKKLTLFLMYGPRSAGSIIPLLSPLRVVPGLLDSVLRLLRTRFDTRGVIEVSRPLLFCFTSFTSDSFTRTDEKGRDSRLTDAGPERAIDYPCTDLDPACSQRPRHSAFALSNLDRPPPRAVAYFRCCFRGDGAHGDREREGEGRPRPRVQGRRVGGRESVREAGRVRARDLGRGTVLSFSLSACASRLGENRC